MCDLGITHSIFRKYNSDIEDSLDFPIKYHHDLIKDSVEVTKIRYIFFRIVFTKVLHKTKLKLVSTKRQYVNRSL